MLRLDGKRRAPFFDDAHYTQSTRETHERRSRRYQRAARDAGLQPLEADTEWITAYFLREATTRSIVDARRQLPAVAYYFRVNGCGDVFPYDEIVDLLRETPMLANDPLGATLAATRVPWNHRRRARAFADKAMKDTRHRYGVYAQGWEIYARRYGIDPLLPRWQQFRGYLTVYARTHRYRSVSNLCSALSNYFRAASVDDLTRHEQIRELLTLLASEDAATSTYHPLYSEDARAMVACLGNAPMDVRDRNVILLNYYGTFLATDLRDLDTKVEFKDDGIVVNLNGREIFIGGVDDPELDVRIWMRRWLNLLPHGPGPLFPAMVSRGAWSEVPLTEVALRGIVRRAARLANISAPHPTLALRKGFAIRVNRVIGPIQTASHMRLKKTSSLQHHVRMDRQPRSGRPGGPVPALDRHLCRELNPGSRAPADA